MSSSELSIAASVAQFGWTAVGVDDREPSYVYSVGLTYSAHHPEILICGLNEDGLVLLKLLVYLIAGGEDFSREAVYSHVLQGVPLAIRPVHSSHLDDMIDHAKHHCQEHGSPQRLRAVQVFWPDDSGRFPFDADCDPDVASRQMRLDLPRIQLAAYELK